MKIIYRPTYAFLISVLVCINGALIMIIELVGARSLTPHFGSSTYVWTAVIGTVMAALAAGYYFGGWLADKHTTIVVLSSFFWAAGSLLMITTATQTNLLEAIQTTSFSLQLKATLSSFLLFAPCSFCLGAVSPYSLKLVLHHNANGKIIGKIYALGTLGSIIGTFLTGYYLIDTFGLVVLQYGVSICLLAIGFVPLLFAAIKRKRVARIMLAAGILFGTISLSVLWTRNTHKSQYVYKKDSLYASYQVVDTLYKGIPARLLVTDVFSAQSGISLVNPKTDALFTYIEQIESFVETKLAKGEGNVLIVGGGSYTLPTLLQEKAPLATIDIVEIDTALDEIAEEYFYFNKANRTTIYHQDGRTFLNQATKKYDIIVFDVYSSLRPPFQLLTKESVQKTARLLTKDGVVVSNIVATDKNGVRGRFAASVLRTYQTAFKHVNLFYVNEPSKNNMANMLLVASDTSTCQNLTDKNEVSLGDDGIILTDNYAPLDKLLGDY